MKIFENLFKNSYKALQKGIAEAISEENIVLKNIKEDVFYKLKNDIKVSAFEYGLRSKFNKNKKSININKISSKKMHQVLLDIVPNAEYNVHYDQVEGVFNGYFITLRRYENDEGSHVNINANYLDVGRFVSDVKKEFIDNHDLEYVNSTKKVDKTKCKQAIDDNKDISNILSVDIQQIATDVKNNHRKVTDSEDIVFSEKSSKKHLINKPFSGQNIMDKIVLNIKDNNPEYMLNINEFHKFNKRESLKKISLNNGCIQINNK